MAKTLALSVIAEERLHRCGADASTSIRREHRELGDVGDVPRLVREVRVHAHHREPGALAVGLDPEELAPVHVVEDGLAVLRRIPRVVARLRVVLVQLALVLLEVGEVVVVLGARDGAQRHVHSRGISARVVMVRTSAGGDAVPVRSR